MPGDVLEGTVHSSGLECSLIQVTLICEDRGMITRLTTGRWYQVILTHKHAEVSDPDVGQDHGIYAVVIIQWYHDIWVILQLDTF